MGISERKKMFILVVVGVVDSNFDVTEKNTVVREFPGFILRLLVGVIRRFLQVIEEATIEDLVAENYVGHKHFKLIYYNYRLYLGFWFRKIFLFFHNFFLVWFDIHLSLFIGDIFFLFFFGIIILNLFFGFLFLLLLWFFTGSLSKIFSKIFGTFLANTIFF